MIAFKEGGNRSLGQTLMRGRVRHGPYLTRFDTIRHSLPHRKISCHLAPFDASMGPPLNDFIAQLAGPKMAQSFGSRRVSLIGVMVLIIDVFSEKNCVGCYVEIAQCGVRDSGKSPPSETFTRFPGISNGPQRNPRNQRRRIRS